MKLKHYNPETCKAPLRAKDLCMVLRKNGAICFPKPIIESLKLKMGDKLEVTLDEEKNDWYLNRMKSGFELRSLGQQMGFSSMELVNKMWPGRRKEDKSIHVIVSETPMHYDGVDYYLITFPKK